MFLSTDYNCSPDHDWVCVFCLIINNPAQLYSLFLFKKPTALKIFLLAVLQIEMEGIALNVTLNITQPVQFADETNTNPPTPPTANINMPVHFQSTFCVKTKYPAQVLGLFFQNRILQNHTMPAEVCLVVFLHFVGSKLVIFKILVRIIFFASTRSV